MALISRVSFVWHTEQIRSSLPFSVQVGAVTVCHSPKLWPVAGISVASFTASQFWQWMDWLPVSVQVAA